MTRLSCPSFAGLTLAVCLIAPACAAEAAAPGPLPRKLDRYDFAAVTAKLKEAIDNNDVPGLGFIVVKDGTVVYEQAMGTFNLKTTVPIASATKLWTATTLMTLVDQKKLTLDDKVSKYLDYWPADKSAMTVRQTLSCTHGLPSRSEAFAKRDIDMDQAARIIAKVELRGKPGEVFVYGGNGFQIAGRVAEVAGGKPWADLFRRNVAEPLGLKNFRYQAGKNPWLGGGSFCDLEDYAKLLCVHLDEGRFAGKRILSAESVKAMQRDEMGEKTILVTAFPDKRPYGLSWWLTPPAKGQPVTEFSDPGAFGAVPWIDTQRKYGAFLLIQKDLRSGAKIWRAVKPAIQAALAKEAKPPRP